MANSVKKQLHFGESEMALRAVAFLDKAGRLQSEACVIAINQMIEKYGLSDASPEEVKLFLSNFKFIESVAKKGDKNG